MKKASLLLLITVLTTGIAFAQPKFKISAGAGGFFSNNFGGGFETSGTFQPPFDSFGTFETKMETPYLGGGGYAFFDATYAELSIGYFSGKVKSRTKAAFPLVISLFSPDYPSFDIEKDFKLSSLNLGLFGKYPIAKNKKFAFFPLIGVEWQLVLYVEDNIVKDNKYKYGDNTPSNWSAIWFKGGIGGDYYFSDRIFIRLNLLYGIRGPNEMEVNPDAPGDSNNMLGHGLTAKLAAGFTF